MNIATLLRRSAADHPADVALRLDGDEVDYAGYAERGARFAACLRNTGVEPGERVGFLLPNCPEYLVGLLGTWQAGAVGVPLNRMFPDAALRHVVRDSGLRVLVLPAADRDRAAALLGEECPELLTTDGFAAALAAHEPAADVLPRLDGEDACIMYTSGSTGVPKGVRQTHRNLVAEAEGAIGRYRLTAADHVLNCMPLFHVGGLQLASLPLLLLGGQITFMPRWDVVRWLELAQELRPTFGGLISTMMIDVGNRTVGSPVVLDSFRICMFGGSRTPTAAIERLEAGTGIDLRPDRAERPGGHLRPGRRAASGLDGHPAGADRAHAARTRRRRPGPAPGGRGRRRALGPGGRGHPGVLEHRRPGEVVGGRLVPHR